MRKINAMTLVDSHVNQPETTIRGYICRMKKWPSSTIGSRYFGELFAIPTTMLEGCHEYCSMNVVLAEEDGLILSRNSGGAPDMRRNDAFFNAAKAAMLEDVRSFSWDLPDGEYAAEFVF